MLQKHFVVVGVCAVVLAACGAALPSIGDDDVKWANTNVSASTDQDLRDVRNLYVVKCGSCHAPYLPSARPFSV